MISKLGTLKLRHYQNSIYPFNIYYLYIKEHQAGRLFIYHNNSFRNNYSMPYFPSFSFHVQFTHAHSCTLHIIFNDNSSVYQGHRFSNQKEIINNFLKSLPEMSKKIMSYFNNYAMLKLQNQETFNIIDFTNLAFIPFSWQESPPPFQ
jgi:hypothetical protein